MDEENEPVNEAGIAKAANKSILDQMQDLIKRKEVAKVNNQQVFKEMKKEAAKIATQESKVETPVVKKQPTIPAESQSYFKEFEDKLVKDFGLIVKIDNYGWHALYFGEYKVLELVPRKGFRFGVYREDPENENKWKCFRVETDHDTDVHYAYAKEFVEINSE